MLIFYLIITLIGLIITVCEIYIRQKRRIVKIIHNRVSLLQVLNE